ARRPIIRRQGVDPGYGQGRRRHGVDAARNELARSSTPRAGFEFGEPDPGPGRRTRRCTDAGRVRRGHYGGGSQWIRGGSESPNGDSFDRRLSTLALISESPAPAWARRGRENRNRSRRRPARYGSRTSRHSRAGTVAAALATPRGGG